MLLSTIQWADREVQHFLPSHKFQGMAVTCPAWEQLWRLILHKIWSRKPATNHQSWGVNLLYSSKLLAAAIMVSDTPSEKAVSHRHDAYESQQNPIPITCRYFLQKSIRSPDSDMVPTDCQYCPTWVIDLLLNFFYPKLTCKIGISHIHVPGDSKLL